VVSTSNPTAAFSAFQTGPLLLYSSNYSVYPITRLSGPRSRPNSLKIHDNKYNECYYEIKNKRQIRITKLLF
jgi:hypothetical protein